MQNIHSIKTAHLIQDIESSGNLPISVGKWRHSFKNIKSSGKLPISVYENCVSRSQTYYKIVKKVAYLGERKLCILICVKHKFA